MYIEQLYTNCLAEAAYYIESDGVAAIIDPLRETSPYIELAKRRNAKIKYVFETHFHADFVSGHVDLAREADAVIVYGPTAEAGFDILVAKDNEEFILGSIILKVLHTPGHTMESSCFLLKDENGNDHAVFTGDTLFVGDVGRPDLAVKSDLTRENLAGLLYNSLNIKLKTLADDVIVYPAHGAGSACGKNIGKETFSTIGQQKKYNYALQATSKEEFVSAVLDGLTDPPKYFFMDALLNKNGYSRIDELMKKNTVALSTLEFLKEIEKGALVLDTRDADIFEKGFISESVNIGLSGQYAPWVGAIIDANKPLVLIAEEGKEAEAILRLARVGYENIHGYLKGGIKEWENTGNSIDNVVGIDPADFVKTIKQDDKIIDVRNQGEWETGIIEGATLISLNNLENELSLLDKTKHYYIHCAGGYRSMMASSLMKKNGFTKITNVRGGVNKVKEAGLKLVLPIKN